MYRLKTIKINNANKIIYITPKNQQVENSSSGNYPKKNLPRFIANERNNPGTRRFNKLHIRGSNIRDISGGVEAAGGSIPWVTEDSDNRLVNEVPVHNEEPWNSSQIIRCSSQEDPRRGRLSVGGAIELLRKRDEEGNPEILHQFGRGGGGDGRGGGRCWRIRGSGV